MSRPVRWSIEALVVSNVEYWKAVHDPHCFQADDDSPAKQV